MGAVAVAVAPAELDRFAGATIDDAVLASKFGPDVFHGQQMWFEIGMLRIDT